MGFMDKFKKYTGAGLLLDVLDGDDPESIARPEYYTDPIYTESQGALKDLGLGLMKGDVPDYYKAIGETGSDEFENMLDLTKRDISNSVMEANAASGRARGGNLPAQTAGAISDAAIKARYGDYERSLAGKQYLLNTGINTTTGVRGSAQAEQGARNAFNWNDYNAQIQERAYKDQQDAALGKMIGTIASIGLGVATGGASFGVQGAMAGGLSALTGGSDMSWLLNKNPKQQAAGVGSLGSIDYDDNFSMKSGYNDSIFG